MLCILHFTETLCRVYHRLTYIGRIIFLLYSDFNSRLFFSRSQISMPFLRPSRCADVRLKCDIVLFTYILVTKPTFLHYVPLFPDRFVW